MQKPTKTPCKPDPHDPGPLVVEAPLGAETPMTSSPSLTPAISPPTSNPQKD
ncbi:hypothetical protein TIFTF001_010130 [Ficus carica]|uniref:Uncharacterized protein n=1 Tax=Ficus carica TaxID=3494 RepID=A0AA87ZVX1_FICCA|nr:hypothetical protein TIFTF001_010130 [Ficus carica]